MMRRTAAWTEARLNVLSGAARAGTLGLLLALVVAGLTLVDLRFVRGLDDAAQAFRAAGGATWILSAKGHVDPQLCERLASQPGVTAAGSLRRTGELHLTAAPQQSIPTYEATAGLLPALTRSPLTSPGVVLSDQAASIIRARAGDPLALLEGSSRVAAVYPYPEDGRTRELGFAAISPAPATGSFDQCWVEQWPVSESLTSLLRSAVEPGSADLDPSQVEVGQLNKSVGTTFDGGRRFRERPTALAPLVALLVGSLLSAAGLQRRRLELAAALHHGVRPADLLCITTTETLIWATPTLLVGSTISLWFTVTGQRADAPVTVALGLLTTLGGVAGALLGGAIVTTLLREDRLFSYFKQR